ncbi:MAG: hypothetical protein HN370_08800 [Phycisphaerales bacterium]|jgi:hypothetical protein|nr:hypothetical protein [Phycisphaerales bacterium]
MKLPQFILLAAVSALLLIAANGKAEGPVRLRDLKPKDTPPAKDENETAAPDATAKKSDTPKTPAKRYTLRDDVPSVIQPTGQVKTAANSSLLRDGEPIISRTIRVRYNDAAGLWMATVLPAPKQRTYPLLSLLPCRLLEALEPVAKKTPDAQFDITGEICVHEKKSYLLLRRATLLDPAMPKVAPAKPAAPVAPKPDPKKPVSDKPAPKSLTVEPATLPATKSAEASSDTDDLIKGMLTEAAPGKAILTPSAKARTKEENTSPVAPTSKAPAATSSILVDRIARVIRVRRSLADQKAGKKPEPFEYELRFVGDNTLREPPMRILPNSKLAEAIKLTTPLGRTRWKLHVSGEVTSYQTRRYVLLRKVMPSRDMGQF